MRTCKKCLQTKQLEEFKKHSNGYRHACRKCQYDAEMQNPVAHANKVVALRRYRASEHGKKAIKEYSQSEAGKESRKKAIAKYERGTGKAKKLANTVNRRLSKIQRTPKWLTAIDYERIENEYKVAALLTKVTGNLWHVDHIIPLQGKIVSGLHVPSNLRAIPAKENMAKHNNFEVVL